MSIANHASHAGPKRGALFVLLSAAFFGVMPILIKLAYQEGVNAKTLLALRFTFAAAGMWLVWLFQRDRTHGVSVRPGVLLPLVAMGALGYVGQSFSYFTALGINSASATALVFYIYPALVTLLA